MKFLKFLLLSLVIISCSREEIILTPPIQQKFEVSLSSDIGGVVNTNGGRYINGVVINVIAIPDKHYLFDKWSDGSTDNPRSILVDKDIELKSIFVKKKYPLSVTIEGEGIVNEQIIINNSRQENTYQAETTIRLTSTPNDGWEFLKWEVDDVEIIDNPIDVKLVKGSNVFVYFTRTKFNLEVNVLGEGSVKEEVIIQPSQYNFETQIRITAFPNEGWEFVGWSGDVESTENPIEISLKDNIELIAIFEESVLEKELFIRVSENLIPNPFNLHPLTNSTLYETHGVIYYKIGNTEFLFFSSGGIVEKNTDLTGESILFRKIEDKWVYIKSFYNEEFESVRNVRKVNETTYVMADSTENFIEDIQNGAPIGRGTHMWLVEFGYDTVSFKKISTTGGYYHDVSYGDINGDGLFDVVAAGGPGQLFLQQTNGTFKEYQDVFPVQNGAAYFSIEVGDLYGDFTPEVIWTSYIDGGAIEHLNSWVIMKWNPNTETFYEIQRSNNPRVFHQTGDMGGNKTRIVDINNDGNNDIIIGREGNGGNYNGSVEIWLGDGNGKFEPKDIITDRNQFMMIEFRLMDVNLDGYQDIVLVGGGAYNSLRLGNTFEEGWDLNDLIYINDGTGSFSVFNDYNLVGGEGTTFSNFLPYMRGNNLTFMGTLTDRTNTDKESRSFIFEVELKNIF